MPVNQLNQHFTTAPILKHPYPSLPFVVEVDGLDCKISADLFQCHGHPGELYTCAFFLRKLTSAKCNYDVDNKEIFSMKAAIEE